MLSRYHLQSMVRICCIESLFFGCYTSDGTKKVNYSSVSVCTMNTIRCLCGKSCFSGKIATTMDMQRHIKCTGLCYQAHGSSAIRIGDEFRSLVIVPCTTMRVDENVVNILLFWHANITDDVYKIR